MQLAVRCRRDIVHCLEGLVEAALFFIAAVEGDHFDGVIGLQETLRCTLDALANNVCMDSALNQGVETRLQLFAVYVEFSANRLNGMPFIEIFIQVVPDLLNQLDVFIFHERRRFNGSY